MKIIEIDNNLFSKFSPTQEDVNKNKEITNSLFNDLLKQVLDNIQTETKQNFSINLFPNSYTFANTLGKFATYFNQEQFKEERIDENGEPYIFRKVTVHYRKEEDKKKNQIFISFLIQNNELIEKIAQEKKAK